MMKDKNPNPGSFAAVELGCRCPQMDNGYGDEELGRIRGFYTRKDCPIHGSSTTEAVCDKEFLTQLGAREMRKEQAFVVDKGVL
jgi:hypothetical protein